MTKPVTHTLQAMDTYPEDKPLTGRPSTFNEATAYIICERLAGGETLTGICKTLGMPHRQTVNMWRRKNPSFDSEYRVARVEQMEAWGDDCVEIADDSTFDTMDSVDKQGNSIQVANHANVQRDRLRCDVRHKQMATIAANVFGTTVSHEHSGEVHQRHTIELSDRERMRRLATFMLEDQAAGVVIDGSVVDVPNPATTGDTAQYEASTAAAKAVNLSPADIVNGLNISPQDETET